MAGVGELWPLVLLQLIGKDWAGDLPKFTIFT